MAKLTKADIAFLEWHGIMLSETFDASGLSRSEYGPRMKAEGKVAAFGVTRCARERHSLRYRKGTCLRCFPASIRFLQRADEAGIVYIAHSEQIDRIKIGYSSDQVDNRLKIANYEGLGCAYDWRKIATFKSRSAGRIELNLHAALVSFAEPRLWIRNGKPIYTREVFDCTYDVARAALSALIPAAQRKSIKEHW